MSHYFIQSLTSTSLCKSILVCSADNVQVWSKGCWASSAPRLYLHTILRYERFFDRGSHHLYYMRCKQKGTVLKPRKVCLREKAGAVKHTWHHNSALFFPDLSTFCYIIHCIEHLTQVDTLLSYPQLVF